MSHSSFATGVLPGVTSSSSTSGSTNTSSITGGVAGTASGAGSALLPTVTAELRSEFPSLLATLASCTSDLAPTYVMELFFTLVRFDAVLKAKERQLLVTTAQQLITRQLQQLQKVHHTRTLLDENERFVGELVERCAALECLCLAPNCDGDGAAVDEAEKGGDDDDGGDASDVTDNLDNQTNGFVEVSGQTIPTLRLDDTDDGHDGHDDGGETIRSVASAVRQRHPAAAANGGAGSAAEGTATGASSAAPTLVGHGSTLSASDLRRFSFEDSLDDIVGRAAALHDQQHPYSSRQKPSLHRRADTRPDMPAPGTELAVAAEDGVSASGSGSFNAAEASALYPRQRHMHRPPPLPLSWTADGASTHTTAGQAQEKAQRVGGRSGSFDTAIRNRVVGHANSTGASSAATGDVIPAVYSGVRLAMQQHFRNNVRHTLTGGATAATVPNNLNELILQQQQQQQQQGLLPDASPTSSPGPARYGFPAAVGTAAPAPVTNLSIFSMGTMTSPSALYPNGSFQLLGIDAGGPLGQTLGAVHSGGGGGGGGGGLSSGCSPTTQEPVDTARVWDRMFWRFLDGRSATGDLAVLLELLNTGNRAYAPAPTSAAPVKATGGVGGKPPAAHAGGRGGGGGGGGGATGTGGNAKGPSNTSIAISAGSLASSAMTAASPPVGIPSTAAAGGMVSATSGTAAGAGGGVSAVGGGVDAAGAAGPRGPSSSFNPPVPELGPGVLMEALRRSGSYLELLPPLSPTPLVVSGGTTSTTPATAAAVAAPWPDASVISSGGVSLEATVVTTVEEDGEESPRHQQQQQRHGSGAGGDTPGPLPPLSTVRTPATAHHTDTGAAVGNGSNTVLLNLEDFAREEETRLHRDFWTHIPAILATLTEGLMHDGGGRGDGGGTDGSAASVSMRHRGSRHTPVADLVGGEVASARVRDGEAELGDSGREAFRKAGEDDAATHAGSDVGDGTGDGTGDGAAEALGELHPPCAEALQLLPMFSPLLHNHSAAVQRLIRQAPEYARTTQTQHARAFAVVAAAAAVSANAVQSQSSATTPRPNVDGTMSTTTLAAGGEASAEKERSDTVTPVATAATTGSSAHRVGVSAGAPTRTGPQGTSGTDLPELRESYVLHGAGRAHAISSSPALADTTALEQSLLNAGSHTHVRPVDVVAYALVTAIYVQCATALEARQQEKQQHAAAAAAAAVSGPSGRATAVPMSMTAGAGGVSPSDDGCTPGGLSSPRGTWASPTAASFGASFAAPVGTAHTAGAAANNASLCAPGDEEQATDACVPTTSPAHTGVSGGPGWWWNGSLSGGGGVAAGPHSLNASIGLAANTFYYPYMQPLASALRNSGPGHVSGCVSNGSFQLLQPYHSCHGLHAHPGRQPSSAHGGAAATASPSPFVPQAPSSSSSPRLQQQQQHQQPMLHSSFGGTYAPTDAALSLLRTAQEEMASGVAEDAVASSACSHSNNGNDTGAAASLELHTASPSRVLPTLPRGNLHAMQLPSPELVSCANDLSWVSLPCVMKAELQHLQQQLRDASRSVRRMEGQVRGELALLLFRVLSLVLDWLMPAVYVADQRAWLFYRKWCCDLYRVLCTDVALLEEFRRLLNQSGVAISGSVAASASEAGSPLMRRAVSLHDTHGPSNKAKARSATNTPTLRPMGGHTVMARTPPQPRPHPPGSPTAAIATVLEVSEDSAQDPQAYAAAVSATSAMAVSPFTASALVDSVPHALEDAFSFILPGSSLAVSVWHERPPVPPGVCSLLEQEEANRRGEAWVDTASLRAAKALLGGEGTVVPLPRPVLITRLVAATLRGIEADVAESLLWVVGQDRAFDAEGSQRLAIADDEGHRVSSVSGTMDSGALAAVGAPGQSQHQQQQQGGPGAVAARTRGRRARRYGDPAGAAAAAPSEEDDDDVSDEEGGTWSAPRRASHLATRVMSEQHLHNVPTTTTRTGSPSRHGRQHRTTSADVALHHHHPVGSTHVPSSARLEVAAGGGGGGGYGLHSEGDNDDEYNDGGYGDQWFGEARRRRHSHGGPLQSLRSPVTAHSPGTLLAASMSASPMFPRTDARASFSEGNSASCGEPQLAHAPQLSEGPTLVHHHRFRYPAVHGYADVAKLYLSTLEEAELVLSAHDPVYASLVLSAADLHLHDLRDKATAASLVNAYLADVGGEHIQGPVWEALPAVSAADGAGATPGGTQSPTLAATAARPAAPGKGFSVTRVRQGNTQGPTSTTAGPSTAAPTPASPPSPSSSQQQPHVPMVIASWNNEGEKDEFIATLQLLRQMQLFLTMADADGEAAVDDAAI